MIQRLFFFIGLVFAFGNPAFAGIKEGGSGPCPSIGAPQLKYSCRVTIRAFDATGAFSQANVLVTSGRATILTKSDFTSNPVDGNLPPSSDFIPDYFLSASDEQDDEGLTLSIEPNQYPRCRFESAILKTDWRLTFRGVRLPASSWQRSPTNEPEISSYQELYIPVPGQSSKAKFELTIFCDEKK